MRQDAVRDMTNLFRRLGLITMSEHTQNGRGWLMPTRLPRDEDILQRLTKSLGAAAGAAAAAAGKVERLSGWQLALEASSSVEVLRVAVPVGSLMPAGAFERLVAACGALGSYVKCWSGGAHLELAGPKSEGGIQAPKGLLQCLLQLRSNEETRGAVEHELVIESCAEKDLRMNAWAIVVQIHGIFKAILEDFPRY